MKFEIYGLRAMFVLCMVLCFATISAMLFPSSPSAHAELAATRAHAVRTHAVISSPAACAPISTTKAPCLRAD